MPARVQPTVVAILILVGVLSACGPAGPDRVVDGWPIGERVDCSSLDCASHLSVAAAGLDDRNRGHTPIVDAALHRQGTYELDNGGSYLAVCSGGSCPLVAVFTLSDGSIRAIGVGSPGISTELRVSDWGPALHWEAPGSSTTP